MKVAGFVGPGADALARDVASRLRDRGRVALVGRGGASADGGTALAAEGPHTDYVRSDDGVRVSGPPRSLAAVLDDVATDHDYALVTGHHDARIPHVVLGDAEHDGEVLTRLEVDDPDVDAATEAVETVERHETLESLVARAKASATAGRAGAIATFTGRVRERDDPDETPTTHLEFETYDDVADERMQAIREELEAREGVFEVLLHHRTGVVEAGEDIVFVVVLAGHREEAFATVSDGIDRLKAEVPIFKKEVTLEGEFWAHERK